MQLQDVLRVLGYILGFLFCLLLSMSLTYYDPHTCTMTHMWCEPHVLWNTCTMKHMSYEPHVPWTTCENEPHVLWTTWDMNIMYYGMNHMRCEPHVSYEPHEMWTSCTMNHTKSVVHSTLLKNVLCLHCTVVCDSYDSMIFNLHDPLYNEAIYLGVFVFQLITAFWYSWVFIVEYPSLILSLFQQDDYLWLHALTVHKGHNDQ